MRNDPVETVGVGDHVTLRWEDGDITRTATGTVADIKSYGRTRVLIAPGGGEIGRYSLDELKKTGCSINYRYAPAHPELFKV